MQTGWIIGQVFSGGLPVTNVVVTIDGTGIGTNTVANGRFTLTNVPVGSGYLLKLSVAGYESKSVPGIIVPVGTNDLGVIQLSTLSGPFRLIPLQPDVNPTVTKIEEGGVGYRYYRVVTADGKMAAGGIAVSLRIAGGSTISQAGDASMTWAGNTAGVSDGDGIVRLRIPASALGAVSSVKDLEVLESGVVKATFQAMMVSRQYYQVWKQRIGGGASGKIAAWKLGGSAVMETEVRDWYKGNSIFNETVQAKWESEGRAGLEFSTPGVKLGSIENGVGAGAGGYLGVDLASKHLFPANTSDEILNLYKLIVALGGPMIEADGLAHSLNDFLTTLYGQDLLQATLIGTKGQIHLGAYADGEALLNAGTSGNYNLKAGGEFDVHMGGFLGFEKPLIPNERAVVLGLESELSGSVGAMGGYMKYNKSKLRGLGLDFSGTASQTITAKAWTPNNGTAVSRVEVEFSGEAQAEIDLSLIGWKGLTGQLDPGIRVETTETLEYDLPDAGYASQPTAFGAAWQIFQNGLASHVTLGPRNADDLVRGILETPEADNQLLGYTRTIYTATQWAAPLAAEVDGIVAGLDLRLVAKVERGAEAVLEKGQIWQSKRLPLEWYANNTTDLIPSGNLLAKEALWISYAATPLKSALNQTATAVTSGFQNIVVNVSGGVRGVMSFGAGVMDNGAYLISKWRGDVFGGVNQPQMQLMSRALFRDPATYGSSSLVPSNYIYGLGGVFRFESTNAFNGTANLTISYSDLAVTGLNENDLKIYRQSDATNQWVLVGGTVNAVSNTVTTAITNLGTYAVAPPLPTGDLQILLSTNVLVADGISQMTAVVTNLILNTGNVATQQWLFTAIAKSVEILNPDLDTNAPGVQAFSTNGSVSLLLRAPLGGATANISVGSAPGDAFGMTDIGLLDTTAPTSPTNVVVTTGQSRLWVSWGTNSAPDLAGYRVYYRRGQSGPPWDGDATVEGTPSPVQVGGTNCLLRGLALGTNYFVSVSAVDTTGNESPSSIPVQTTTVQGLPMPPTSVAVHFGTDGTNILMWALSEDDGYNDRDVIRYDVLRAVLPGGSYLKIGEVAAGLSLYSDTNLSVLATQYIGYAVVAVDSNSLSSSQTFGNRVLPSGSGVDNDGDGMADAWETANGLNPQNPTDAGQDPDNDSLTNLQEYQRGSLPLLFDNLRIGSAQYLADGRFQLAVFGEMGRSYALEASTNLVNWTPISNFTCTNSPTVIVDTAAMNYGRRFYRIAPLTTVPRPKLGFGSTHPLTASGLDLSLEGLPGFSYRVEAATNVIDWLPLTNLVSTNSMMYFRDPAATNFNRRFYRAVLE